MYTVQELSKIYKCTRQTIYKKIEHEDIKQYTYKDDKGLKLKQEGLEVLNYLLSESKVDTKKQETNRQDDIVNTTEKDNKVNKDKFIDSLNKQIELLSKQVKSLENDKKSLQDDKVRLFEELREQRILLTSNEFEKLKPRGIFKRMFNLK